MPKRPPDYPHAFQAKVEKLDFGRMYYSVVYVPRGLAKELKLAQNPRLRIRGLVEDEPFQGACQPTGGRWYLLFSKRLLKNAGLSMGQLATVRFEVADQNAVEVPDELTNALRTDPGTKEIWDRLTPGRRRGLAHRVAAAKRPETREQRVLEIMEQLHDLEV